MKFGKFEIALLPGPTIAGTTPDSTELMCTMLRNSLKFARDKQDNLYVYQNGVYQPVGKDVYVACIAIYANYGIGWTTNKDNQVMDYLIKTSPELLERPDDDKLNLLNGLYYINEDRFESHEEFDHSSYLTTIQLPIQYNPTAVCTSIDKFMHDVFPEGSDLLYDVIGLCMTPVSGNAKAVVLLGGGSNGKSVYLYGLRSIVGIDNVSTISMHTLGDRTDRFACAGLVNMLANAADDMSQEKILDTANIKSIISGNPIRVEGKYKAPVTYRPFCKLVFGANHRLESNDETTGYIRRIMHIPFNQTFPPNPAKERELHEAFSDPIERSGLLNEVLKRLKTNINEGLQIPESARDLVDNYVPINENAKQWLLETVEEDENGRVPCYQFHLWAMYHAEYTDNRAILAGHLKYLFPTVKHGRPRIDGKQVMCYVGLKIKDPEAARLMMVRAIPEGTVLEEIDYLDPDNTDKK